MDKPVMFISTTKIQILTAIMADKKLLDMASKVAGEFNYERDFEEFTKALRKQFWESTLVGELDDHPGYAMHEVRGHGSALELAIRLSRPSL